MDLHYPAYSLVDLVINFIIFLIILQLGGINNTTIAMLPEFFDKRLASWNTENIYQTPIHDNKPGHYCGFSVGFILY
jgi:hypothetical protein